MEVDKWLPYSFPQLYSIPPCGGRYHHLFKKSPIGRRLDCSDISKHASQYIGTQSFPCTSTGQSTEQNPRTGIADMQVSHSRSSTDL